MISDWLIPISGAGLLWTNLAVNPTAASDDQHFNFGYVLMMLMVDIVFYSILTWYAEHFRSFGILEKSLSRHYY